MTKKEDNAKRGRASRRKGQRGQLEVNRFLNRLGIPSKVVARAGFKGPDLTLEGASGQGQAFSKLSHHIRGNGQTGSLRRCYIQTLVR
jgi:hypothetical protein